MVKILIELQEFLMGCAPLLLSLAVITGFSILLARSIKKRATVYYILFSIPFILVAIPIILRWCGVEMTFSFTRIPILGQILRDYIHMGTFGHPLLIVIMYMGALDPKIPAVKKLMSIRKELSIISGFPIFTHSLIRVSNNFPNSLRFFTDHSEYMAAGRVVHELGAGISSFSMVLGILMLALFIPLWVTSFDSVHKRMGNIKWKKLQKWSYVLYATLFIHAMGIQVGGMLNPRGGNASRPTTEITTTASAGEERVREGERSQTGSPPEGSRGGNRGAAGSSADGERSERADTERSGRPERQAESTNGDTPSFGQTAVVSQEQPVARSSGGVRAQAKGFANIEVSAQAKRWIHIISLVSIYGSYLFLRVRKARKKAKKRANAGNA